MIPDFYDTGAPWKVLPPGIHLASLDEIRFRFAINEKRKILFDGLREGVKALRISGCGVIYLDGSYVTEKPFPGDFDVCWVPTNVQMDKLDRIFLDFENHRFNQKKRFGGEFFPSSVKADGTNEFLDFFQIDKYTGKKKGIIEIQ